MEKERHLDSAGHHLHLLLPLREQLRGTYHLGGNGSPVHGGVAPDSPGYPLHLAQHLGGRVFVAGHKVDGTHTLPVQPCTAYPVSRTVENAADQEEKVYTDNRNPMTQIPPLCLAH
jgi:hypothetical protein